MSLDVTRCHKHVTSMSQACHKLVTNLSQNVTKLTHSSPPRGLADLLLSSEVMFLMELFPLLGLCELSEGSNGKLLEYASGMYPKKEQPSSPE